MDSSHVTHVDRNESKPSGEEMHYARSQVTEASTRESILADGERALLNLTEALGSLAFQPDHCTVDYVTRECESLHRVAVVVSEFVGLAALAGTLTDAGAISDARGYAEDIRKSADLIVHHYATAHSSERDELAAWRGLGAVRTALTLCSEALERCTSQ